LFFSALSVFLTNPTAMPSTVPDGCEAQVAVSGVLINIMKVDHLIINIYVNQIA